MKKTYLLIFLLGMAINVHAQLFEWEIGFHGFADNREYVRSNRYSQTIMGLRLAPAFGMLIDSTHRIRIGIDALQEFGSSEFGSKVDPIIYYQYRRPRVDFYMGLFPRTTLLKDISPALLNDTLTYYQPQISGMMAHYHHGNVEQKLWIDWLGKQSYDVREQFLVGLEGTVRLGHFFLNHQATLWHNALSSNPAIEQHIQDNLALLLRVGWASKPAGFIDSLRVSMGGLFSADRLRHVYDWRSPRGVIAHLYAAHRMFFVENELYVGDPQIIPNGISFFAEKFYHRVDVGWVPLKGKRIDGSLTLRFHFTPKGMDNQQVLSLRYFIGGDLPVQAR